MQQQPNNKKTALALLLSLFVSIIFFISSAVASYVLLSRSDALGVIDRCNERVIYGGSWLNLCDQLGYYFYSIAIGSIVGIFIFLVALKLTHISRWRRFSLVYAITVVILFALFLLNVSRS